MLLHKFSAASLKELKLEGGRKSKQTIVSSGHWDDKYP